MKLNYFKIMLGVMLFVLFVCCFVDAAPIEIPADSVINVNTIWSQDVHLNGKVYVENAVLIIMPGVSVWNSYYGGIIVRNNGVIKAKGTPDNWITFISDAQSYHNDYEFAIKIEEGCSLSEISYCYIVCAAKGIWIQNTRLENSIEDVEIEWCYDGIVENGTALTDIINCQIINSYDDGIEISLADVGGVGNSATEISIKNNTINGSFYYGYGQYYGQDYGITIWGVANPDDAGKVVFANNLIVGSYQCAVNQVEGYMEAYRICNGYYNNYLVENPDNPYDDISPQILTEDPFVNGYTQQPFYLIQNCNLIDAGCDYIDATSLVGKTTSVDGIDSNVTDIGYHYTNWDFANAGGSILKADFDSSYSVDVNDISGLADMWLYDYDENYQIWFWDLDDNAKVDISDVGIFAEYWLTYVNFLDFAEFAKYWQQNVDYKFRDTKYDLNKDGFVNLLDFSLLAAEWQKSCEPIPTNITPEFDKEPNNLSRYVEVSINVSDPNIYRAFLLVDGKRYGEFDDLFESEVPSSVGIDTSCFSNGEHEIKIVVMHDRDMICSEPVKVIFNNELHDVISNRGFRPGKDYYFYGMGLGNYTIEIYDNVNENIVYPVYPESGSFQDNINVHVPASVFVEQYGTYELTIKKEVQAGMMQEMQTQASSTEDIVKSVIARTFHKEDFPPNCNTKIVISCGSRDVEKAKSKCIIGVITAAVRKGMNPVYLDPEDCSWENLEYCLLNLNNTNKWYHASHGSHNLVGQPPRQCISIKDGKVFSYLKRNLVDTKDYQELSGYYENNHSLADLYFHQTRKLNWVQFNCCYSGRTIEFPEALGIVPENGGVPIGDSIFIGWKNSALMHDIIGNYNNYEEILWEQLGYGETLQSAFDYATSSIQGGLQIMENFIYYGVISMQYAYFRPGPIN